MSLKELEIAKVGPGEIAAVWRAKGQGPRLVVIALNRAIDLAKLIGGTRQWRKSTELRRSPTLSWSNSRERVEEAIADKRAADAQATKEQLRQMAEKAGFDIRELYGKRGPKGTGIAKYRNPKDQSQTWTGRGRKPNWLLMP